MQPTNPRHRRLTMHTNLPTTADLNPLWEAAHAYALASTAESQCYKALSMKFYGDFSKAGRDPELTPYRQQKDALGDAMDAVRDSINARFPGLNLLPLYGFAGWGNGIAGCVNHIYECMRDCADMQWRLIHETDLLALRESITALPPANLSTLAPGVLLWADTLATVHEVVKVSHSGKRIGIVDLRTGEKSSFKPERGTKYHALGREMSDQMLVLYASRQTNWDAVERLQPPAEFCPRNA